MYTIKWGHLAHFPSKGKGCKGSERGVRALGVLHLGLPCGCVAGPGEEGRGHRAWKDAGFVVVVVVVNGDPFRHTTYFRKSLFNPFKSFKTSF